MPALREVLERLGAGGDRGRRDARAALRIALAGLLGWPLETAGGLEAMHNCGWAVLAEHGAGRLRLSSYNTDRRRRPPPD